MIPDPERLYDLDSGVEVPEELVLLYHLDGFVDAGSAGSIVVERLLSEFDGPVVARFDVDRLIDYRSRRPAMTFAADRWMDYHDPELVVRLLHGPDGTPLLLLTGPEPDVEWESFIAAVRTLVQRWRVRLSVNFHGIPMNVPHTRPLGLTAHATRPELVRTDRAAFSHTQVPGSAAALLEYRLGQAGHDVVGFTAHVPHYLAQTRYPAAAARLLDVINEATGLSMPITQLRDDAHTTNLEIDRQVRNSAEVAEVVAALERQYDAFIEANPASNLLAEDDDMPTGDELADQFQRFLAEQQQGRSESGES